jgi:hypothetical protein
MVQRRRGNTPTTRRRKERKEDQLMAKRKGKNQSVPAKNAKYADRNNTKKMVTKKG